MNWWYYFKKRYSLYPGLGVPVCAPFLRPYYERRRQERSWARAGLDGLLYLLFQAWVPVRARFIAHRYRLGRTWARAASAIGRRRFADPNDIAVFRITRDEDLDRYLRRFEYAEVSRRTNPAAWTRQCALADKALFAARCAEHGLPHPCLLARLKQGQVEVIALPEGPALAIKPTGGVSGTGFSLLQFEQWQDGPAAFKAFLHQQVARRTGDWIVQGRVEVHTDLRDIALDALSTARITTMRNERGEPEIVTAVLRFAGRKGVAVDNLAAGGLLAPIHVDTGTLGPACHGRRPEDVTRHPLSGAVIEGRRLPNWKQTCELVRYAHRRAFAEYSMIGWDVGISAAGPVLIGGNGKPGLMAAQRAERHGIGETRFGELLAFHLDLAATGRLAAYLSGDGMTAH